MVLLIAYTKREERKQMAEKHRFKKDRGEFKMRHDQQEENEEGDIRSFKFHSLEKKSFQSSRKAGREAGNRNGNDRYDRSGGHERHDRNGGRDRFDRSGGHERFDRSGGKKYGKKDEWKKKRYDHED